MASGLLNSDSFDANVSTRSTRWPLLLRPKVTLQQLSNRPVNSKPTKQWGTHVYNGAWYLWRSLARHTPPKGDYLSLGWGVACETTFGVCLRSILLMAKNLVRQHGPVASRCAGLNKPPRPESPVPRGVHPSLTSSCWRRNTQSC